MLVKVGPRGQITIPKSYRTSLQLDPGDSVALVQVGDELHLKADKETIFDFIGSIPSLEDSTEWEDIRIEAREERAKKVLMENDE
jgi:AbrB family looped-hinge helix DNA binding protein